jgi:nitrite reductase (NADH) large subunit
VKFVFAGNGIAATTAAQAIVAANPTQGIEIYMDEPYPSYLRPRLIRFLAGELDIADLYLHPPEWYSRRGITVRLGTAVTELDTAARRIVLDSGEEVSYDRLLLAVGSNPFQPPLEGMGQEGVFTLRTIDDALAIRSHAEKCLARGRRQAVVIGGGLMGLECANALATLGLELTVLEHGPWLLHKQIDEQGAAVLEGQLGKLGIRCLSNVAAEAILADDDGLSAVRLEDGRRVSGHLVLCSAGVRPNTELARAAGLAVGRGVLVDSKMLTSADDVYAAGDVTEYKGEAWCIIPAALEQARVAGANMMNPGSMTYQGTVPSTTLKVVGADLTSIGIISPPDQGFEELRKSDPAAGVYQKLVLDDGHIVGAILMGARERVAAVSRLIREGTDVSAYAARLLDDDFDLGEALA